MEINKEPQIEQVEKLKRESWKAIDVPEDIFNMEDRNKATYLKLINVPCDFVKYDSKRLTQLL